MECSCPPPPGRRRYADENYGITWGCGFAARLNVPARQVRATQRKTRCLWITRFLSMKEDHITMRVDTIRAGWTLKSVLVATVLLIIGAVIVAGMTIGYYMGRVRDEERQATLAKHETEIRQFSDRLPRLREQWRDYQLLRIPLSTMPAVTSGGRRYREEPPGLIHPWAEDMPPVLAQKQSRNVCFLGYAALKGDCTPQELAVPEARTLTAVLGHVVANQSSGLDDVSEMEPELLAAELDALSRARYLIVYSRTEPGPACRPCNSSN